MTVTTHIAEIFRQGIWASLTGGWYYEPTSTPICNIIHMYLWIILLVGPLFLGFYTEFGDFPIYLIIGYALFIATLFSIIKLIVAYFHMLFDTTDPVIVTKTPRETDDSEDTVNNVEASSGFDHSDRFEMIELRDMRDAIPSRHHRTASSSHGTSRRSSASRRGDEPWVGSGRDRRIRLEQIGAGASTSSGQPPSEGWPMTTEEPIINEEDAEVERVFQSKTTLEMAHDDTEIRPFNAAVGTDSLPSLRKMSEPTSTRKSRIDSETRRHSSDVQLMSDKQQEEAEASTSSEPTKSKVLRYNKDMDGDRFDEKRSILETLVDDVIEEEEHLDEQQPTLNSEQLAENSDEGDSDTIQKYGNEDGSSAESLECLKWRLDSGTMTEAEYREQVSRRLILKDAPKKRPSKRPKSGTETTRSRSTGSREGPKPSAQKRKRPSEDVRDLSVAHQRVSNSLDGPSTSRSDESNSDFKIEITRFLEELIDKHPETLDAIESVRLSRLNRVDQQVAGPSRRQERSPDRSRFHLAEKAHVASGHEDTSEGAIHSFQDEHGNWWTYTFDEHGVGTAQALGSGRTLRRLMEKEQAAQRKGNKSSSSEEESTDDRSTMPGPSTSGQGPQSQASGGRRSWRGTPIPAQINQARDRAASSSSNESFTYIPQVPAAIFHGPTTTNVSRSGRAHSVSFGSVASRLRAAIRHNSDERSGSELEEIISSMTGSRDHHHHNPRRGRSHADSAAGEGTSGLSTAAGAGSATSRFRFLQEMTVPSAATLASAAAASLHFSSSTTRRNSSIKKSYYYKMRLFPKASKQLKIKMDRLSLAALFDRNRYVSSAIFDVILATLVSVLGSLLLSTGIFFDLPLFFLCFTIAGSQFSLLKSVQPDAASPIHGFNWLVAYSRPVYFCLLASLLLFVHNLCPNPHEVPWNFNVYRWSLTSWSMILLAVRDVIATCLIFLPIAFTIGWLPQITTLVQHVLEQIEMNVFGGTASIGIVSSGIQVTKSLLSYFALVILCRFAYSNDPTSTQNLAFSTFLASVVGISYFLSRFSSNHHLNWLLFKSSIPLIHFNSVSEDGGSKESALPSDILYTVRLRGLCDILIAVLYAVLAFALHTTSIFTTTQPYFTIISMAICTVFGIVNHYFYNQLRIHNPWKIIANPILKSFEWTEFESINPARLMSFEILHIHMGFIERVILYPLVVLSFATECGWSLPAKVFILPLVCMRILRGGYSHPQLLYCPLAFSLVFCLTDAGIGLPFGLLKGISTWSLIPLVLYISVVVYPKWLEFYLKLQFVLSYVAPWQISWGSAFHAFAQPFAVPHSALVAIQAFFSSIISAPLNPFLGSSFFTISYVRPVKFWERNYNTKRADASNTRLAFQFDRGAMVDDSNLNAIFYEHLTRSLQKSLAGDLAMGRWATSVQAGDCFILASFYLNCLLHIVEVGNGMVTFQLRGLEFRGTYCHQREVEAISEDLPESGFWLNCPFIPAILTMANSWGLRWLAWEVVSSKYIIEGYSITDNSAVNLLQVHELRRLLVSLYVKCIIYFASTSARLTNWMEDAGIKAVIDDVHDPHYIDSDHMFCSANDEDFDIPGSGISRASFMDIYSSWITMCVYRRTIDFPNEELNNDRFSTLCLMLSLCGRRALGTAAFNRHSNAAESFLYGLHALFKGDFRITSQKDEWIFNDIELLKSVIAPAVKMALKLHQHEVPTDSRSNATQSGSPHTRHTRTRISQLGGDSPEQANTPKCQQKDHFANSDDLDESSSLYDLITSHQKNIFISHEQDPAWREAILANAPSLLALRHVYDEGQDDYKIIMLNRMQLNMRVIRLNRECVRAFWAGQQQELIFLRNRNPERGSIQNARQVLRNMINSSADQPVGYPIYVSPLTTSFVDTHPDWKRPSVSPLTLTRFYSFFVRIIHSLRSHLGFSGSSSLGGGACGMPAGKTATTGVVASSGNVPTAGACQEEAVVQRVDDPPSQSQQLQQPGHKKQASIVTMQSDGGTKVTLTRDSTENVTSLSAPTISNEGGEGSSEKAETLSSKSRAEDDHWAGLWMQITDCEQVFKCLNEPLKSTGEPLVVWPDERIRQMSGRNSWCAQPINGMYGKVVYCWEPNHLDRKKRSHIGQTIYLIAIAAMPNCLVPVGEKGCKVLQKNQIPPITLDAAEHMMKATLETIDQEMLQAAQPNN